MWRSCPKSRSFCFTVGRNATLKFSDFCWCKPQLPFTIGASDNFLNYLGYYWCKPQLISAFHTFRLRYSFLLQCLSFPFLLDAFILPHQILMLKIFALFSEFNLTFLMSGWVYTIYYLIQLIPWCISCSQSDNPLSDHILLGIKCK